MSWTLEQIAQQVAGTIDGSPSLVIDDVAGLEHARAGQITYLDSRKQVKAAATSPAAAILTSEGLVDELKKRGCQASLVLVKEPQVAFIEVMLQFRPLPERPCYGIHPTAVIHETVKLGEGCNVFPHAYIGENVTLGNNCDVGPGAVISDGCQIGDDCTIHANAVLYREVTLKDRVIIHANAVIGADGFGYRFENGRFIRLPHTGTVLIENDVEIGAAATIDRGMIGATVIGEGTKLDNQVMIAHNCQIGKHNAYASQVGLAGSCTTGDYIQMGGQVGVADHVNIGSGSKFGGKAGVIWDMPAGGTYHGIPAINEKEAIRNHFSLQKLPELREQVKELTQQLASLQQQLASQTEAVDESKSAA